jgi:ferredoxin
MKREIIRIDEDKCDGCGLCVPNCPEGALQIIDEKARLVSDFFCDGLGACIGHCPQGAITVEERDAEPYDERRVMANIVEQGENTIKAHLHHLADHGQTAFLKDAIHYLHEQDISVPEEIRAVMAERTMGGVEGAAAGERTPQTETAKDGTAAAVSGCPGCQVLDMKDGEEQQVPGEPVTGRPSRLGQWPVQITLVPPFAPYLQHAELLIAADCVPFAYADFHEDLLEGKVVLVGCPKLDDASSYVEKFTEIFKQNHIGGITIAHMEVPCCFGLERIVSSALAAAGKDIPLDKVTISVKGERLSTDANRQAG